MLTKAVAVLALAGSAAAFAPTMSLSANRRELIQGAGAAAVVAPMLRPTQAEAKDLKLKAPVITLFDNRGCDGSHANKEATSRRTGGPDDEMCIKVVFKPVPWTEASAAAIKGEALSFKEKGIDGDKIGKYPIVN